MPQARLKTRSNDGLVALSNAHAEVRFDVLGAWPDGDTLQLLIETRMIEREPLEETLTVLREIHDFEFRHSDAARILFEVTTSLPEPHGAMAGSGVVPSFPLHVEGGWLVGDLVVSRDQLSSFRDELEAAEIEFEITSITVTPEETDLLTTRQREVVDAALEDGYYEMPRECSLTDLAERFGVNKSVVSRVLHRAEGRIVAAYRSSESDRA